MSSFKIIASLVGLAAYASSANAQNLVQNGSFEDPALADGSWSIYESIPGWTSSDCGIEIQRGAAGSPANGAQLVELDSWCSDTISQTLDTTPGDDYTVSF